MYYIVSYLNIQNVFVIFNQTPNSGVVGLSQKPACSDRLCCQYYEEAEPPYHRSRVDSEYSCTLITLSKIILTIMCRYMMYWQLKKKLRNLSPSGKSAVFRSNQVGMKTPIPFFYDRRATDLQLPVPIYNVTKGRFKSLICILYLIM